MKTKFYPVLSTARPFWLMFQGLTTPSIHLDIGLPSRCVLAKNIAFPSKKVLLLCKCTEKSDFCWLIVLRIAENYPDPVSQLLSCQKYDCMYGQNTKIPIIKILCWPFQKFADTNFENSDKIRNTRTQLIDEKI
jgi:hypothetical protein